MFELDESDVWNVAVSPEFCKTVLNPRMTKRSSSVAVKRGQVGGTPASLPVSVPDWSKILKGDYTENRRRDTDDDDFDDDDDNSGEDRIPPHEVLARRRIASFSVHEGIGRTLKGRDLTYGNGVGYNCRGISSKWRKDHGNDGQLLPVQK
ncbi:hypothetical protein L1987_36367 [Smallanthus sonchifolius]|uniref:Uncharacterized protein n=1 Tax=Smallanthus sonchifolius TaxID=185202 RepID=A0ACB9HF25_9ASTR|nr:hypothetical protein L1987_36367 [Smallanthus sonchifolius]